MDHEKRQKILKTKIILGLIFIAIILWVFWIALVYSKNIVVEYTIEEPTIVNLEQTEQRELVLEKKLYKTWRAKEDPRQEYINETYKLWWIDLVVLFECEWHDRDISIKWDWWHAWWLCQMNDLYHNIPDQYYTDRRFQIEYCFEKRQWWTLFYWPDRADGVNWEKCMSYAKRNFYLE